MKSLDLKHMQRISFIWGTIMIFLVVGMTIIGFIYKNKTKEFKEFEEIVAEKAKDYLVLNNLNKVTIEELKNSNIIDSLIVDGKNCTGYVVSNNAEYKSYIKCGSYKTKGY